MEILSTVSSWCIFCAFLCIQIFYFSKNIRKLKVVKRFFQRERQYEVTGENEDSQLEPTVAPEDSSLHKLILELNKYTKKNHGTTDFSIIQNKTERKIEVAYEDATSRLAFPIYIGLMGTFLGVFLGLLFFILDLGNSSDGITDAAISNLIKGVLVSMSTSFIGLLLSTISNNYASTIRHTIDQDKNEFYEFIQNELMPTLGVSMVAALNKLHHTINLFEPSFNKVIDRFQVTFDYCTRRFGEAFEKNVTIISEAVRAMGQNMDKINQNVDLNERLIKTMQSEDIKRTLEVFIDASYSYGLVVDRTHKFEEIASLLEKRLLELINTQKQYNSSLEIPLSVANKLNSILNRFSNFENSINALGKSIENTQLFGNSEIELIKEQLTAIKKKQKIAMQYIETSDGQLENIFNLQNEEIRKLNKKFEESLINYAEQFEDVLNKLAKEMQRRRSEIVTALEEKFSLDQIQKEFSQLSKLEKIEELLNSINHNTTAETVERTLTTTRHEVSEIKTILNEAIEDTKKKGNNSSTSGNTSFLGSIFGRNK